MSRGSKYPSVNNGELQTLGIYNVKINKNEKLTDIVKKHVLLFLKDFKLFIAQNKRRETLTFNYDPTPPPFNVCKDIKDRINNLGCLSGTCYNCDYEKSECPYISRKVYEKIFEALEELNQEHFKNNDLC